MTPEPRTGPGRGRLLRLVIAFAFAQGAVPMARPAVSYRALVPGECGLPRSNGVESVEKRRPSASSPGSTPRSRCSSPFALLGVGLVGAAGPGLRGEGRTEHAPVPPDTGAAPVQQPGSDDVPRR